MTINALMKTERNLHLDSDSSNKANGYRPGRVYGHGKLLELRIPRDRNGEFYPNVLALLRRQQEEVDQLVSALYGQGLSQAQVGEVFERLYGRHYSSSQIGRMIDWMRADVAEWLGRPLQQRYPVVFIDGIHVKVRRDTVANEAFYVVLGVKPEARREVLAIVHQPVESAVGWEMVLSELADRGVSSLGLVVADGLSGLESAVARIFPQADFQRCVTHVKRRLLARIRPDDTPEAGWARWQDFCRRWASKYRRFNRIADDPSYRACFTYLNYDWRMRCMVLIIT